jgi:hypothetical protein
VRLEGTELSFNADSPDGQVHFVLQLRGRELKGGWQLEDKAGVEGSLQGIKRIPQQ